MLFNSYIFILGFLPAVLLIYQLVSRFHPKAVVIWLGVASLLFYAYWKPAFLLVLGTSVVVNYLFASLISRKIPNGIDTQLLLMTAIVGNLGALCWFKYLFPMLNFVSEISHSNLHWTDVALPLGISFFTFTQIAYLVDLQQGAAERQDFSSYLLFVTFFPHLIAGPILHHKDIMPQFQKNRRCGLQWNDLAVGFSWFAMGLFKKSVIADNLAGNVNEIFAAHAMVSPAVAWGGALGYAMQLYFDFSGYSDMALGLARMFSIDFPLNFASPHKSASIIEFWQRWHMTLTQYIGSYLYSPIQFWISRRRLEKGKKVTRKAQATLEGFTQMIAFPTIATMFIAGIWHGAGLQFLVFGVLHGIYLTVNHWWRGFRHQRSISAPTGFWRFPIRGLSVLLTFLCVVLALVFFRASSVHEAMWMLQRMAFVSVAIPASSPGAEFRKIALAFVIVWCFPNTQQILSRYKPALALAPSDEAPRWVPIYWSPNVLWAIVLGISVLYAFVNIQNPSTFLYFQF